ncbi:MAG: hypothetical protein KZQ83_16460 [gamma proteobacterium symbiont of Taylorina sp.]|nr:hypothetical protein [gamma proteobacterium symbiont of Taylorina sp.]
MSDKQVSLIVPDLFDPVPDLKQLPASELPELTAFSTLLSRGTLTKKIIPYNDYYSCLFNELGYSHQNNATQLPIAGFSYLFDIKTSTTKHCLKKNVWIMRADPCFMAPDRDQLLLAETKISISQDEAEQLVSEINQFYQDIAEEYFWQLVFISPQRWYIVSDKAINLHSTAPEKVLMQPLKSFLYSGEDSQHWINLSNEFQMILHQSSVNKERQKQGKIPVNSIWFWGAGESIDNIDNVQNEQSNVLIYTDNIIAKGLCQLNHYSYADLSGGYLLSEQQHVIYIIDDFMQAAQNRDIFSRVGLLQQFEKQYLEPLLKDIKSGKITEVQLISPTGKRLLFTKKLIKRWWKRIKPYHTFL